MHRLKSIVLYSLLLLLLFALSCKKDIDSFGPDIEIYTPIENQTFNVNDVVTVSGLISDESAITSVSVGLINELQQLVHTSLSVSVTDKNMSFNMHYALDNIHLETGNYYLMVTASDGSNESRSYRKINIIAVPRVLQKILIVTNTSSVQTNWSYVDTNFSAISPLTIFAGDYCDSYVSSYYQMAYNCGNYSGNFTGYNLTNNSTKFSMPVLQTADPYYTGLTFYDKYIYVAKFDGSVKGYDYTGNPIYNAQSVNDFYSKKTTFLGSRMIAEQKNYLSQNNILASYYATGSVDVQLNLLQDVIEFSEKDNSNVFVFGNITGQATIQLFNIVNNNLWNPYPFSLPPGALLSVVKIDSDTYLLGHSNGTIYKYQYQTSSVTTYATGYVAKKMIYDNASNRLYVAENNKISVLDYSNTGVLKQISTAENILNIHLLFNR